MAVDVMVVAADEPLRQVLEIALAMDGCHVQTVAAEAEAIAVLRTRSPDVLLIDDTTPLSEDAAAWAERHAPRTSLVLLEPAWQERHIPERPRAVVLLMPFGLRELRRALSDAARPAARAVG